MTEEGGAFQREAEHEQRRNAFKRKETSNMEASTRIAAASGMGPELEEECQGLVCARLEGASSLRQVGVWKEGTDSIRCTEKSCTTNVFYLKK